MIESGQPVDARVAERRSAGAPSTMRADSGAPVDVVVLDISRSGVRIVTDAPLQIGQEITIGLAGAGVTRAYVAWARGSEYGCAFERVMEPEDEARAFTPKRVQRLGVAAPRQSGGDDYLRELHRTHRVWTLPWDAVLMTLALVTLAWGLFRFYS